MFTQIHLNPNLILLNQLHVFEKNPRAVQFPPLMSTYVYHICKKSLYRYIFIYLYFYFFSSISFLLFSLITNHTKESMAENAKAKVAALEAFPTEEPDGDDFVEEEVEEEEDSEVERERECLEIEMERLGI